MLALSLAVLVAGATPGAQGLAKARALFDDFQLAKVKGAVNEALQEPGLDTPTLISLYELEGLSAATLGDGASARAAFARLLTLDPAREPPRDLPPKGRTFFFAARTLAQREALELTAQVPERTGGFIEGVAVTFKRSALLPAVAVRFTVSIDEGAPTSTVVPLTGADQASLPVHGKRVKWSAALLGAREAVLRVVEREELPPVEAPPAPPPVAVTAPAPAPVATWVRPVGLTLGAVGLAAVGTGVAFGVMANDARAKLAQPNVDANGVVQGLTQVEAQRLDQAALTNAAIANTLFIAGGAVTVTGALMWLLGPRAEAAPVALSVSPAGVFAAGRF